MTRFRIERAVVRETIALFFVALFTLFVLGIQTGIMLSFLESEARFEKDRESLEKTATTYEESR